MAQVASAVDVDVAHRVVVGPRKDREEVEVLRGSLHRVVRVLQTAQLHLRLQETVFLPGRADGGHVLPRVGQQVDLRARVVVPKSHERSHDFREGARYGDVVLRRHRGLLRVHREHLVEGLLTSAESRTTCEARTRTFWISKSVLSVAPAGCAPRSRTTAQSWRPRTRSLSPGSAAAAASSRSAGCPPCPDLPKVLI